MAITIQQSPTSPNMANADLIYVVTGNSTQPQFQFVCDIQDANRTVLQRIKQQPNPSGKGVFDVGQVVSAYLSSDQPWRTAKFATGSNAAKAFWVAFGEEYGTSTSSSITMYNGIATTAGAPAKSGSAPLVAIDGLVETNAGYWNFPSSSYYTASIAPTGTPGNFSYQHGLSNAPTTQAIQNGEYATIGWINGNTGATGTSDHAQDVYYVEIKAYNSASANIQTITNYYNVTGSGGWPRVNNGQEWPDVYDSAGASWRLMYVGVGPQNISDAGTALNSAWSYYTVTAYAQESAGVEDATAIYWQYRFNKQEPQCVSDGVRFAWKNEFGVWDYYTATLAINSSVQIERNSYDQSFVDFSTSTNGVNYNIARRGTKQFQNLPTQRKTVTSAWLNQTNADWLREIFLSGDVYVQENLTFLPVVITTASVAEKTNPRSQKIFQYTFEFQYANQLRPRI